MTEGSDADHRRVVTALRNISQGTNLEDYLDVDNILKYMAVHSFSVNEDSLSGSMAHNYYLYEHDGRLNILPWDYNLAFGGMGMGKQDSAIDMINDPVDTPFPARSSLTLCLRMKYIWRDIIHTTGSLWRNMFSEGDLKRHSGAYEARLTSW